MVVVIGICLASSNPRFHFSFLKGPECLPYKIDSLPWTILSDLQVIGRHHIKDTHAFLRTPMGTRRLSSFLRNGGGTQTATFFGNARHDALGWPLGFTSRHEEIGFCVTDLPLVSKVIRCTNNSTIATNPLPSGIIAHKTCTLSKEIGCSIYKLNANHVLKSFNDNAALSAKIHSIFKLHGIVRLVSVDGETVQTIWQGGLSNTIDNVLSVSRHFQNVRANSQCRAFNKSYWKYNWRNGMG